MSNTMMTASEALANMAADTTEAAHFFVDRDGRYAKLTIGGRTVCRIDRLTDGTVRGTGSSGHTIYPTWDAAAAWMNFSVCAAAMTQPALITYQ